MTEEQYKKAEQIRKEVLRNESVIEMLKQNQIRDTCITNLRIT